MNAYATHGGLALRAISRRRTVLLVIMLMPIALYAVRRDAGGGQAVRALLFGITWTVSTVAMYAHVASQSLERRLGLGLISTSGLAAARSAALLLAGLVLAGTYWLVVAVDQEVRSIGLVGVALLLSALVAVAVGTAVGALLGGELEGTLVLFLLAGMQAVANPFGTLAKALPFWSYREIGTVAIDGVGSTPAGLAHAGTVLAVCSALVLLNRRRTHREAPDD